MALTRKLLSALGIEADKIDQIIDAHTETVDGLKKERDEYKAKAERFDEVKAKYDELKATAKDSGDYEKLKKEFDDYKAEIQNKETATAKREALKKVAKDAGLTETGINKAVKYADLSAIELDEEGNVKDAKSLMKSLKEEWPEHIAKAVTSGANTATPSSTGTGKSYKSKDEIMQIKDDGERQKAIAENHEMFGF